MADGSYALTVADLHSLNDDDGSSLCTDDDSYIGNSSLRRMVSSSFEMLECLASEVADMSRSELRPKTTTTVARAEKDDLRDMTIDVSFQGNDQGRQSGNCHRMTNDHFPFEGRTAATTRCPPPIGSSGLNYVHDDDLSLDDSVAHEMKALKEATLELRRELKSHNSRTVLDAIERIGNSNDPNLNGVLESGDKEIIRRILDDDIRKNAPNNNAVGRFPRNYVMGTLNEEETCRFLVAVVVLLWSLVLAMILQGWHIGIDLL
jgi:hypothetical protein